MTPEQAAATLNGRQYLHELPDGFETHLKESGLVVVFGASDDNMEFCGAINDEIGAWQGTIAHLDDKGLVKNQCDDDDCPYFRASLETSRTITAVWCPDNDNVSWAYETDIPHATFLIKEDDEEFCRGIVFRLADAKRETAAEASAHE